MSERVADRGVAQNVDRRLDLDPSFGREREPTALEIPVVALVGVAEHATQHTNDPTVRDDEADLACVRVGERDESETNPFKHGFVCFVTRRTHVVLNETRVVPVDFTSGETLPRTHIDFTEAGVRLDLGESEFRRDNGCCVECPYEVARGDVVDALQLVRGRVRLATTFRGERRVGMALHPALGVPLGLAVANEQKTGRRHAIEAIAFRAVTGVTERG